MIFLTGCFYFFILGSIRITPKDSRWVGAWWLSFLVAGLLSIMSSIPFFFLPQNPDKPQKQRKDLTSLHLLKTNEERSQMANMTNHGQNISETITGKYITFIVNSKLFISNESR